MPKNIIICSDGTGNTAIKGRGTNVFKIFESVDLNSHRFHPERPPQVAIYDDGVGTEAFKFMRVLGGAAGYGLSRNVRQLYRELCRIYDPGDQIYLFGFSRGAFTVRSLSGFIGTCGIIDVKRLGSSDELDAMVERAYRIYRGCYRTWLMRTFLGKPNPSTTRDFRDQHCHGNEKIHFVGVWDTVDAVGLPLHVSDLVNTLIYQFKFPDLVMSSSIERAAHALSIDDERQSFHPLIWDEGSSLPGQTIEQVWFAGVHSNVGGGYPKQGMSLVALDWMMHHAEQAGLRFIESERQYYREHANADDKLYDPRTGAGNFYRWLPRDIAHMCKTSHVQAKVHLSVLERIAHGSENYCPGNLPANAQVVFTPTGDLHKDASARARAAGAQEILSQAHHGGDSLLASARSSLLIGRFAYRAFALTVLATLVLAASAYAKAGASSLMERLLALVVDLITSPISTAVHVFWRAPSSLLVTSVLIVGLAIAAVLARWSTRGMNGVFRGFWFTHQQNLREALKKARVWSAAEQTLRKVASG